MKYYVLAIFHFVTSIFYTLSLLIVGYALYSDIYIFVKNPGELKYIFGYIVNIIFCLLIGCALGVVTYFNAMYGVASLRNRKTSLKAITLLLLSGGVIISVGVGYYFWVREFLSTPLRY
jgi:hypothetical protein